MKLVIEHHPWEPYQYVIYLDPTPKDVAAADREALTAIEKQMLNPVASFPTEAEARTYCEQRQAAKTIAEYEL